MPAKLAVLLALAMLTIPPTTAGSATGVSQNHLAHASARASGEGSAQQGPISPPGFCAGQADADAPTAVQLKAMRCLIDFARRNADLAPLSGSDKLDRSAGAKSADILRCDDFSHSACGRDVGFWMERVGYIPTSCWRVGENIAWGSGPGTTAGEIFKLLIHSPGHRANILGPYSQVGLGLRIGSLDGHSAAHVWTQHFGSHC